MSHNMLESHIKLKKNRLRNNFDGFEEAIGMQIDPGH